MKVVSWLRNIKSKVMIKITESKRVAWGEMGVRERLYALYASLNRGKSIGYAIENVEYCPSKDRIYFPGNVSSEVRCEGSESVRLIRKLMPDAFQSDESILTIAECCASFQQSKDELENVELKLAEKFGFNTKDPKEIRDKLITMDKAYELGHGNLEEDWRDAYSWFLNYKKDKENEQ